MLKQNILFFLLLHVCFLKPSQYPRLLIFELDSIELEMEQLRRDDIARVIKKIIDASAQEELRRRSRVIDLFIDDESLLVFQLREAEFERRHQNPDIRNVFVRRERVQQETSVSIEKPRPPQTQRYYKNNNRVDRARHAQFNMRVQQPKPKHRRRG